MHAAVPATLPLPAGPTLTLPSPLRLALPPAQKFYVKGSVEERIMEVVKTRQVGGVCGSSMGEGRGRRLRMPAGPRSCLPVGAKGAGVGAET